VTLRRVAVVAAVAVAVFVAVIAATFPTDTLLRALIARAIPSGSVVVAFTHAHLRPWGLRVDGVAVRAPDGSLVADAEWLSARPSLTGFLRDRTGRPWRLGAGTCGGRVDAIVDRDDGGSTASITWDELDLARCPPVALLGQTVAGVIGGTAVVRGAGTAAEGRIGLRGGVWKGAGRFVPALETLHADPASVAWTLRGNHLELSGIAVDGPDVKATGGGTVEVARAPRESRLALSLIVAPGPQAPPGFRDLLARLPATGDGDARRLEVGGTLGFPQLVRAP
jgi:type II secretion system protein N